MNIKKIVLLLVVIWLFTVFSLAGVEWITSIKSTGKGKKANNEIDAHTYAQGGNVKQVFEGVVNEDMFHTQDGYWLYKADEDDIYIVNDKKYNYMVIPMDGLLQMTGMLGQLVKIQILDHTINTGVLPEETLLGYPCNHLKVTTDYTMKIKIAFIKKTMKFHEEKEIWGTTKIPGLDEINPGFLKKDFKTGIPDLDEMIQKQMEQQKKIGFPLKVITRTTQMNKKGKVKGKTISTMTVTKINSKNFPESIFEIPANYDRVEGPWEKKKLF
jgi:hypothetical protein